MRQQTINVFKKTQKHYCREELCIFSQKIIEAYFPINDPSQQYLGGSKPKLSIWLSYILFRTTIPDSQVFFALHLLRRISETYAPQESSSSCRTPVLFHHQLLLSALILSGVYFCDNTFTNGSWRIASLSLWTIQEIDQLEFEMFKVLEFRLREEDEDLKEIIEEFQIAFKNFSEPLKRKRSILRDQPVIIKVGQVEVVTSKFEYVWMDENSDPFPSETAIVY